MSRSHFLFRDVPMDVGVDRYEKSHQNAINRVLHTFGIPMIAVSIPHFLIAPLVRGFWKIPLKHYAFATEEGAANLCLGERFEKRLKSRCVPES